MKVEEVVFQGAGRPEGYENWHSSINYTRKEIDHPLTAGWSDTWPAFYGHSLKAAYAADCVCAASVYRLDEDLLNLRTDGLRMKGEGGNVRPGKDRKFRADLFQVRYEVGETSEFSVRIIPFEEQEARWVETAAALIKLR